MKILLIEEKDDTYAQVMLVVSTLEKLKKTALVYSGIYLASDRKHTWEMTGSLKLKGVIKKSQIRELEDIK